VIYDAIIIGGGAAGLFSALTAGKRGRRVLVIEHNAEVARKILISGGGRCNFTNSHTSHENFISENPHFCKSALARYTPADFVGLVDKHKIPYYEKKLGQLFCRGSAKSVVEMLLAECRGARVEIRTNCSVTGVTGDGRFNIETSHGVFTGNSLIVASGGLSFSKIGASDLGYRIARQFDLKIVETRPSLVALVLAGENFGELAGVSCGANVTAGNQSFHENILFTHRGMSGPAILQASNYWKKSEDVIIDLLPAHNVNELINAGDSRRLSTALAGALPQRFVDEFIRRRLTNRPINQMSGKDMDATREILGGWRVKFRETEGYDRAEVTLGGVSTRELSSQTMQAKKKTSLYFIGEVVDVTGWLGGYNFQWAWASGFAAGNAV